MICARRARLQVLLCAAICFVAATPAPTVYQPTRAEAMHRTITAGVYGAPSAATPAGPAENGFALALTPNSYTMHVGDNLWFLVELRNVSGAAKATELASKDATWWFSAKKTTRVMSMVRNVTSGFGPPAGYAFPPGTSLFLWFSPFYTNNIDTAGAYQIQAEVGGGSHTLQSNVVTIEVLPNPGRVPAAAMSDASSTTAAGPAAKGSALSISSKTPWVRAGTPMWITTELRNTGSDELDVTGLDMFSYDITLIDLATHKALAPFPNWQMQLSAFAGGMGSLIVPAGESHFGALQLDRFFPLDHTGDYSLQVGLRVKTWRSGIARTHGLVPAEFGPVVLRSNVMTLHVIGPRAPGRGTNGFGNAGEGEIADTRAGSVSHGFALSLTADWASAELGRPIFVKVELRNVSGRPQIAAFGSSRSDYEFVIVNAQTGARALRDPKGWLRIPAGSSESRLYPDSSLYATFSLTDLYRFSESGTYSVRVVGHPVINGQRVTLESNPVQVTFEPPTVRLVLAKEKHVLSYRIQTDRPEYVAGEPVYVRLVVTNLIDEPIAYSLNEDQPLASLEVADERGQPVPPTQHGYRLGRGTVVMPRLAQALRRWDGRRSDGGVSAICSPAHIR